MPSRRDAIRMSAGEIHDYLTGHSRIILVTNGPDGLPHPVPMNYGLDEQGRIVITSFRKSQKVKNLERDPRAALLVETGEGYTDLKSVIVYADVEIIADPEQVARGMAGIRAEQPLSGSLTEAMSEQVRASVAKRVLLRFTPFRYVSWDHGKLAGKY
jgi:nitroimidazol reductase NimA-like FMN-containing flavoprotein (pyridoxamine 5'-phosphate oxidase superfamily)